MWAWSGPGCQRSFLTAASHLEHLSVSCLQFFLREMIIIIVAKKLSAEKVHKPKK